MSLPCFGTASQSKYVIKHEHKQEANSAGLFYISVANLFFEFLISAFTLWVSKYKAWLQTRLHTFDSKPEATEEKSDEKNKM
jgi:hypothetical protein